MPQEEVLVYRVAIEGAEEAARQLDRLEQRVQRARQTAAGGGGGAGGALSGAGSVTRAAQASAATEAAAVQRAAASRSSLGAFGQSAFGPAIAGLAVGFGSLPLQQLTQAGLQANAQVGAYDPARARINIERQTALARLGRSAEAFQQPLDRFGTSLINAAGPAGGLVAGAAAVGQGIGGVASIGAVVAGLGAVAAALGANTAATTANTVARAAGGGGFGGVPTGGPGGGARLPSAGGLGGLLAGAGRLLPFAPALAGLALGGDDPRALRIQEQQRALRAYGDGAGAIGAADYEALADRIPRDRADARLAQAEGRPGFWSFDQARRTQALVSEPVQAFEQARIRQRMDQFQLAGQRRGIAIQREADLLGTQQFAQRQLAEQRELALGAGRAFEGIGIGAGRQAREAFIGAGISRREIGIGAAQQLADIQRSAAISQREIGIGAGETRSDIEQNYSRGRRNLVLGQIGGLAGGLIGLRTQRRDALADLEESVGRQAGRVARGAGDATESVGIGAGRALAGAERGFADQLDAIARSRGDAEADLTRQTQQQVEDLRVRQTQEQTVFQQATALRQREQALLESQLTIHEGLVAKLQPTVDDQITAYDTLTKHLTDLNTFLERQLGSGAPAAPAPSTSRTQRALPD